MTERTAHGASEIDGKRRRAFTMLCLVLAGEAVFIPPFHLGRYFKSSLLSTFQIDEFQLGQLGAVYGIVAMACYFLGGPLADRFSPRKLLPASLVATGLGSLYMSTVPSFTGLYALYAFWGASTILFFWAPLIRATCEWGGADRQGLAFGILDGGRGLVAAVFSAVAAYGFAVMVGGDVSADAVRETTSVRTLLYAYGGLCFFAAVCVWVVVPDPKPSVDRPQHIAPDPRVPHGEPWPGSAVQLAAGPTDSWGVLRRVVFVLRSPAVWLQAVVIVAAYSTFKMFDNYGLYTEDAYGLTPTDSAKLIAYLSFIRVGAALAAGWIADRLLGVSLSVACCFGLLIATYEVFLFVAPGRDLVWLMIANMAVSCAAFYALRGIYFALLEASGTPRELTGTAVGIICFVGFTPEIFMPPLTGWLISRARSSGDVLAGYERIYWILILLSALGVLAAIGLWWLGSRRGSERHV